MIDLNAVVLELQRLLDHLIPEDIDVKLLLDQETVPVVADPTQIEQVLANLVLNARDAMPRGGSIAIETRNLPADASLAVPDALAGVRCVRLEVTDTGEGMDEEVRAHAFEPFFTTKPLGEGSGLGLATVHGIVQQCGGQIRLASRPGAGTRFEIFLPRADAAGETAAADGEPPRAAGVKRGTETILLVEDDEAIRRLSRQTLEEYGYAVLEARHGAEALEVERSHPGPIHALVTDLVMPRVGGVELGERLRSLRPGLGILFISGYERHGSFGGRTLPPGAMLLQKPFRPRNLLRSLRSLLDGAGASR